MYHITKYMYMSYDTESYEMASRITQWLEILVQLLILLGSSSITKNSQLILHSYHFRTSTVEQIFVY